MKLALLSIFLTLPLLAAEKPTDKPVKLHASQAAENAILKAEHTYDQAVTKESQMQLQFTALQKQAEQLQKDYPAVDKEKTEASKGVDDAIKAAFKLDGYDPEKYDFNPADFTYSLKPEKSEKK